jgi:hypothetical protein
MNKKPIDTTLIENELEGASHFFPATEKAERRTNLNDAIPSKQVDALTQASESSQKPPINNQPILSEAAVSETPNMSVISQPARETETADGAVHLRQEQTPPNSTGQASKQESMQAIKLASYHASNQADMIEAIRRVVKTIGAKTTFVRLTEEEKDRLIDVVYTYKRQGIKTSENELVRIAIAYLLEEHSERTHDSTLAKVLSALNA